MIDHTAYPDIIDAIFDNAGPQALLALRAASSAFRDRVDGVLAKHVIFRDNRISPAHSKGWHPAFLPLASPAPLDRLLPFLARISPFFANTVSLDIDGSPEFPFYPHVASAHGAFTALRTLRLRPGSRDYEPVALSLTPDTVIVRTPWPPHPPSGFPITEPAPLVASARRVVYNVDASQPLFPSLLHRALSTHELDELVIVFLQPASPIIDARDRALLRTIITKALELANPGPGVNDHQPARVILVNIGRVPPDCIPIPSSEFDDYITVDADGVFAAGFGMTLPPLSFLQWKRDEPQGFHPLERYVRATVGADLGMGLYDRVHFLSMDEYRASVGREAFGIEVEWTKR